LEPFALRRFDASLPEETVAFAESVRTLLADASPVAVVRAAEPLGYDAGLWQRLVELGITTMAVPETSGGDGGTLVDLAVVAEEIGQRAAPVPFVSHLVTARALARVAGAADHVSDALAGRSPYTLALLPEARQLVPDAAIAARILALVDDQLVLVTPPALDHVPNQGSTPLAWWSPAEVERIDVLASGAAARQLHADAVSEWRILTAAALIGLTASALRTGVEFVKTRTTRGAVLGTLQGIAFPLADVQSGIVSARHLVRRAAWAAENDRDRYETLRHMAWPYAVRVATEGTVAAAHVQGGLGFTVEAEVSLYFLRAKGWGLLGGRPAQDYLRVADALAVGVGA
jgi:alkylation response protein AidB-like acyl-CoA dehydrogenase